MQELWGKVLAGEVAKPGSFSLRTLSVLKSLSRDEAELFRLGCSLACSKGEIFIDEGDRNPLKAYGLHYGALMMLSDAGLLHEPTELCRGFDYLPDESPSEAFENNGMLLELSGAALKGSSISVLLFTPAGRELQQLLPPNPCMSYLKDIAAHLRKRYKLTVKLGVESKQADGSMIITFDEDF